MAKDRWSLSTRIMFVAVIVLALAKGLLWSAVIPPWYGPDEPHHYAYVQVMVEDHVLPVHDQDPTPLWSLPNYAREILCSLSNLGVGIIGPTQAEPPFGASWVPCSASSSADRHATGPTNLAGGYSPLYYSGGIPFYLLVQPQSVEVRLQAVRLWSVLLGVLAAAFAFLAAREAFPESPALGVAAAVLFILQPMSSQQTAVVSNDALLIAATAAFWWRFFRSLRLGVSAREAFVLGGLVGIAYLAKPQGLLLAAALPVLYWIASGKSALRTKMAGVVRLIAAAAAPVIACLALGELFSAIAGNSSLVPPSTPGLHGLRAYLTLYTAEHFERLYWLAITSFWGYFGWFQADLPNFVYVLITLAVIAGIAGAVKLAISGNGTRQYLLVTVLAVVLPAALLQALEIYAFRSNGVFILQGRSFLMLLFPITVVLVRGWAALVPRRGGRLLPAAIVLAATLLNVTSLFVIVDAFYG